MASLDVLVGAALAGSLAGLLSNAAPLPLRTDRESSRALAALPPSGGPRAPAAGPWLELGVASDGPLPEDSGVVLGADFDADGRGDLASLTGAGDVYVALGGGDLASWAWELVASVPHRVDNSYYRGMRVADVSGDGLPDLLIYGDDQAAGTCGAVVIENLGGGNFGTGASLLAVTPASDDVVFGCTGAEIGDYDGDGELDVALSYAYQQVDWFNGLLTVVNVFLGAGGGEFGAPALYPLASDPLPYVSFAMTSGDFDGDGRRDLGFGSEVSWLSGPAAWRVETLRGDGAGGFLPGTVRAFDCPWCELRAARAADFDGDGRDDLVLPPTMPESFLSEYPVLLFASEEGGSFAAPVELMRQVAPVGVEAQDLTGDQVPDVLLLGGGERVTFLEGRGDGTFAEPQRFVASGDLAGGALADLDGDGASELVLLVGAGADAPLLGIARGTSSSPPFGLPRASLIPGYADVLSAPADFDGDGNLDVLAIGYDQLDLMRGRGDGRFELVTSTPTSVAPWPMPIADLNGDGRLDLVQAAGDGFAVSLGTTDGRFAPTEPLAAERHILASAFGDVDGDGHPDLVVFESPRYSIDLYLGDGALGFARAATLDASLYASHLVLEDVNADGHLDLLVDGESLGSVFGSTPPEPPATRVWLGDGRGAFAPGATLDLHGASLLVRDVDGDGALDVIGPDAISFGDGAGRFAPPEPLPSAGAQQIELADLDGDGLLDLLFLSNGLNVARGAPRGAFEASERLTGTWRWLSLGVGQFTGSPALDLLVLHSHTIEYDERFELLVVENETLACEEAGR